MSEKWRDIPGWPGYQASTEGRVRTLKRRVPTVLTGTPYRWGYPYVHIWGPSGRQHVGVHRLVLAAFAGPCPDGLEARHLDGDPTNSHPSNLAWGTHAENNRDRVKHGTHHQVAKTHCPQGHPYDEANTYRRSDGSRQCRACARARIPAQVEKRRVKRAAAKARSAA